MSRCKEKIRTVMNRSTPLSPDPVESPKWRRMPDIRPDAILDSALTEFQEKGFAATRMEDIAIGAGLSKGALYLYFKSKEALFQALVQQAIVPMADRIDAMSALPDETDVLGVMQAMVALAADRLSDPKLAAIPVLVISEAGKFPEIARFYRKTVIDKILGAIARLIRHGQAQGVLRTDLIPEQVAHSMAGGFVLQMLKSQLFEDGPMDREDLMQVFTHHVDLLVQGMKA